MPANTKYQNLFLPLNRFWTESLYNTICILGLPGREKSVPQKFIKKEANFIFPLLDKIKTNFTLSLSQKKNKRNSKDTKHNTRKKTIDICRDISEIMSVFYKNHSTHTNGKTSKMMNR